MAVLLKTKLASRAPVWLVVNHWQSDLAGFAVNSRADAWRDFSAFFHEDAKHESDDFVVLGDFNCEPGDPPFRNAPNQTLEPTRERALVLRARRSNSYLYNPMWRHLGEEVPYEDSLKNGYTPTRPVGTFCKEGPGGVGWRMWDQLFVSKSLLTGVRFRFQERSVRIVRPHEACTDHCAIGATFSINPGG